MSECKTDPACGGAGPPWYARRRPYERSTERILTTHTGSLPAPIPDANDVREGGGRPRRFRRLAHGSGRRWRRCSKQVRSASTSSTTASTAKPATPPTSRTACGGSGARASPAVPGPRGFPRDGAPGIRGPGARGGRRPAPEAIAVQDARSGAHRVANLRTAARSHAPGGVPHGSLSRGHPLFFHNGALPEPRGIPLPSPGHEARSTRDGGARGTVSRSIAGSPRWAATSSLPDLSLEEFRKMARLHVEALDHALAGVPPDQARMHLCWATTRARSLRRPSGDILDIVFGRPRGRRVLRGRQPPPAHEWRSSEHPRA